MFSQKDFKKSLLGVFIYSITAVVFFLLTHVAPVWSDPIDGYEFEQIENRVNVCWENNNLINEEIQENINSVRDTINRSWGAHSTLEFEGWNSCQYNSQIRHIKIIFDSPLADMDKRSLPASMHRWPEGEYNSKTNTITLRGDKSKRTYMTLFGLALGFAPEAQRLDVFRDKLTEGEKDEGICTQINKPLPVYDPENHFIHDNDFNFKRLNYKEWQKQAYNPYSVMSACISDSDYADIVRREKGDLLSRDDIQMLQKAFGANISNGYAYEYSITDLKFDAERGAVINDSVYNIHSGYFINEMPQITIPKNSKITFKASVPAGGSADLYFRFVSKPLQNTDPSFNTKEVTVSGVDTKTYTVDVPAQGKKLFELILLLFLQPNNVGVKITDISINPFFRMRNKHLININKKSDFLTGFYKLDDRKYQFYNNGVQLNVEDALEVDTRIDELDDNQYFVFTHIENGDDKSKSFLFKNKKHSRALLPVDDPLLICDLDDDSSLKQIKRKQIKLKHQRGEYSLMTFIQGEPLNKLTPILLKPELELQKQLSGKIWPVKCMIPKLSDQDQVQNPTYDIFYHDDLYGHMGEVITLFCNKTEEQTKTLGSYTFVDLNPEDKTKNCVNFKEHLDKFVAQDKMVFFRGNGFNGRLYGLLNSYFENGSFNYDAFGSPNVVPMTISSRPSSYYKTAITAPFGGSQFFSGKGQSYYEQVHPKIEKFTILLRKDSNLRKIYFTGFLDLDIYNNTDVEYRGGKNLEPEYYVKGYKTSSYDTDIEEIDDNALKPNQDPNLFDLETKQNVTYAFLYVDLWGKGDQLHRNGTPYTGEIPKGSKIFDGSLAGKKYTDGYENK